MQLASTMYRLLQSPSGRSTERQLVKQLICTHDEQTTAHSEANSSILHDSMRWMDSLSLSELYILPWVILRMWISYIHDLTADNGLFPKK